MTREVHHEVGTGTTDSSGEEVEEVGENESQAMQNFHTCYRSYENILCYIIILKYTKHHDTNAGFVGLGIRPETHINIVFFLV